MNRNVREFFRLHADELEIADTGTVDHDAIERLIVVETVHAERLGEFEEVALRPGIELVVFDHHQPERPEWLPEESLVLSEDGALTTTLVGILAEREIEPTPLEATVFALGIHEDTGSLTYPAVTQRDADALGWCLRHGARQDMIAQYLHTPLGTQERALFEALVTGVETHDAGGFEVLVTAVAWPEYVDGISNLVHKLIDLTDARGLVALVEMGERVFCVSRTRVAELDASALAGALGGGGHTQAASAVFRGSLDEARSLVLAALPGAVRRALTAGEIMSRPPGSSRADDTVAHAMVECQQHRQSGILVGEPAKLEGVVTREDLDKAVAHDLAHAPVKSVMTATVVTCAEETPLAEAQRLVSQTDVGRIAVVTDGDGRRRRHAQRRAARARRARRRGAARRRQPGRRGCGHAQGFAPSSRPRRPRRGRSTACTSWAAPCATSSWTSRPSTSTSPSRGTGSRSAARSRRRSAAAPSRTRSSAPPS